MPLVGFLVLLVSALFTLTPEQRSLRARAAAYTSWSKTTDPTERTRPAREAAAKHWERLVDPDLQLLPAERLRRAEAAKKAHFTKLALKSSIARSRAKQLTAEAAAAEAELAELGGDAA